MPTAIRKRTSDYPHPEAVRSGELGRLFGDWAGAIEAVRPHNEAMIDLMKRRDDLRKLADRPISTTDPAAITSAEATVKVLNAQIADLMPALNRRIEGQDEARRCWCRALVRYQRLLNDLRAEERGAAMLTDRQRDALCAELDVLVGEPFAP